MVVILAFSSAPSPLDAMPSNLVPQWCRFYPQSSHSATLLLPYRLSRVIASLWATLAASQMLELVVPSPSRYRAETFIYIPTLTVVAVPNRMQIWPSQLIVPMRCPGTPSPTSWMRGVAIYPSLLALSCDHAKCRAVETLLARIPRPGQR